MDSINYVEEIMKCRHDFSYFSKNYLKVLHPEKGLINFKLYDFQKNKVLPTFENHKFIICKKFRQAGLSTLASMYCLWKILFFVDQRVLMISITDRDAKNLMSMIQRAWENLPDWMTCKTLEYSQHSIKLETESEIRCGTPKMGRGYSANIIILDEAAFIPNMEEVWKGIFPAISSAQNKCKVFVISTVNGYGNWYSDKYHDAKDGKNDFYPLDLKYTEHPDYNNEEYVRKMKEQLGPRGWDQEVLGIFLSSGDTFVKPDTIQRLITSIEKKGKEPEKLFKDKLWIWEKPRGGKGYIISCDVAEGLGGEHDYSAFHVINIASLEQVCEFCDNNISTYEFAKIIEEVGRYYNSATAVVENNSLGISVLEKLYTDLEYENIYWSRQSRRNLKMGFTMSPKTRPTVLNVFSNLLENEIAIINSTRLINEIQTFEFNRNTGKAEARSGRHDDLIMSFAIGLFVRNTVINEMPIGASSEIDTENFKPTFNTNEDNILNLQDDEFGEVFSQDPISNIKHETYQDEEDLLKEFGW